MGHIGNYTDPLNRRTAWTDRFGPMWQEYREAYQPRPFSPDYVYHLSGWYAQKHPDEDWAETFAVWMTPGYDWRVAYASRPGALAKLQLCDRLLPGVTDREPDATQTYLDVEVSEVSCPLQEFYDEESNGDEAGAGPVLAPALDAPLRGIFEDFGDREDLSSDAPRFPAGELIRRLERDLVADVYRW